MVLPVPAYPPQLDVAQVTGRERVDVVLDPDAPEARLDLHGVRRALAAGAHEYLIKPFTPDALRDKLELLGLVPVPAALGADCQCPWWPTSMRSATW